MPTQLELLTEANRRGILPPEKKSLYDEAVRRGLIENPGSQPAEQSELPQVKYPSRPDLQAIEDERARTQAQGEIKDRELGRTFGVIRANQDGTTEYGYTQTRPTTKLLPSEKIAIHAAKSAEVAGRPIEGQSYDQMAAQIRGATALENSALENYAGAGASTLARIGTGLLGDVMPETAANLERNIDEGYVYDPESKAATVGKVAGNLLPLAPAIMTGQGGNLTAGLLGASQFGSVRSDVAKRRAKGEQISVGQELTAAALSAVAEFAGERIGLGAIQNAVRNKLLSYAVAAGINAPEEYVTQLAQNAVMRTYIDENQDISEGIHEAALIGGATGLAGRGLAHAADAAQAANIEAAQSSRYKEHAAPQTPDPVGQDVAVAPAGRPEDVAQAPAGEPASAPAVLAGTAEVETTANERMADAIDATADKFEAGLAVTPNRDEWAALHMRVERLRQEARELRGLTPEGQAKLSKQTQALAAIPPAANAATPQTPAAPGMAQAPIAPPASSQSKPQSAKPAQPSQTVKGLPKVPREARKWSFSKLKTWATQNKYKVGTKQNLTALRRAVKNQYRDSLIDLPRPPKKARQWTFKQYKWWAGKSGYNVKNVKTLRHLKQEIKAQRKNALVAVTKKGKTVTITPPPAQPSTPARVQVQQAPKRVWARMKDKLGEWAKPIGEGLEHIATPLASRIRDISPAVFGKVSRMQFNADSRNELLMRDLVPVASAMSKSLGGKQSDTYRKFKLHTANGNFEAAKALLPAEMHTDFDRIVGVMGTLLDDQQQAGVNVGRLDNFWPRRVKDYDALQLLHKGKAEGVFEEAFNLAKTTKNRAILKAEEKAEIANSVIQGYGPIKPGSVGPTHARERTIEEVTDEQLDLYADPFESLFHYIRAATYATEKAKFLGKGLKVIGKSSQFADKADTIEKIQESIGGIIQEEIASGRLPADKQDEIKDLLTVRLMADTLVVPKWARTTKQLIYMATLGQFRSALNQVMDVAITAAKHGISNTAKGVRAAMHWTPADERVLMEETGLHKHGEEFKDVGKIARANDWVLRKIGFERMDRFGKESRNNAAWHAFREAAKNQDSEAFKRLERDYADVLGDQWVATVEDLEAGRKSENVNYLLHLDISGIQPVTLSQMPEAYLRMTAGRVMYSLKSFLVTQLDNLRREGVRKMLTHGQRKEGAIYFARLLVFMTLIGFTKDLIADLIRGKRIDPDQIQDRSINASLQAVGFNRYVVNRAATLGPLATAIDFFMPPLSWADAAFQDLTTGGFKQPADDRDPAEFEGLRLPRYVPIVGDLLYYRSPVGRGYYQNEEQANREYRGKLKELRKEAEIAEADGDDETAALLIRIYNERRKNGTGDGRQTPLTVANVTEANRRRAEKSTRKEK